MRRPNASFAWLALVASLLLAGRAAAQAPAADREVIETDRPDQTESTGTIAPGSVQVEAGWTATDGSVSVPETLVRIGAGRRLELRVGFGGWRRAGSESGVADMEAGFKYQLYSGGPTEISALFDATVPTGSTAFSENRFAPAARVLLSHELPNAWSTGVNLGVTVAADVLGTYTWTVARPLTSRLGWFGELFGILALDGSGGSQGAFDSGFTIQLQPNLQLDMAGGFNLTGPGDEWFFGTGLSVRLPR